VPANSMAELITLAKAAPGSINFASSGHGAAAHLAGELFKAEAKINIVHVAYKGAAPALQDVIGGHVQMMFATAASVIGLIKDGKVRALAVTTPKRTSLLPDLPTVDELGIKGFDATTWHGLVAPAGTPKEVIDTLTFAANSALKDPATQKALIELGVDIIGNTPKEFEAYINAEIPKWTAVVKSSGAKVE
jgi:tripartite-type tricarboxylate transporter receptor subunit TctC